jgi:hypothetical protein
MLVVLCAALALTVGAATATGGGNSASAKKCQKGGWKTLLRATDGSSFNSEEECVSWAAQGNTLVPKTKSQLDCESFGAAYSTNPATDLSGLPGQLLPGATFAWSCNGVALTGSQSTTLLVDCQLDVGTVYGFGNANQSNNYSCFGPP